MPNSIFTTTPEVRTTYQIDVNRENLKEVLSYLHNHGFTWASGKNLLQPNESAMNRVLHHGYFLYAVYPTRRLHAPKYDRNYPKLVPNILTPLTNEEILAIFLKEHRKYASFKRQYDSFYTYEDSSAVKVQTAIDQNFSWERTEEGHAFWDTLNSKWRLLVNKLKLTGTIDLDNLPK